MSSSAIDPFHRLLSNALTPLIDSRMVDLANGAAVKVAEDTISTAEKYAAHVSYIKALNDVLAKCAEIELDMYGAKPAATDERQTGE